MPFDSTFALNTLLPLAEASYNLATIPTGYDLVPKITDLSGIPFGFLASRDGVTYVVFRGTESEREWLEDLDLLVVDNQFGPGHVHQGFQRQYAALRSSIVAALKARPAGELYVLGHSLGAALAVLCAGDICASPDMPSVTPTVYTFAGPRVGWPDFVHWLNLQAPCYRIVNHWDIVPHLPSFLHGYDHVGHAIGVNGGFTQDLRRAHNLELGYRPGLAKLLLNVAAVLK